MSDEYEKFP